MTAPRLGSLYSGVGGGDLGFRRAGFRVVFQAERDPYRARVLGARFPGVDCYAEAGAAARDAGPVDALYASPPTREAAWLAAIWEAAARTGADFVVVEGPLINTAGEAQIDAWCRAAGYHAVAVALRTEIAQLGCLIRRTRTFVVARRGTPAGLAGLFALTEAAEAYRVKEAEEACSPAALTEIAEACVGLPLGWTCVCGAATPGDCEESSARLVAANECCSPAMTQWLGAYLRALLTPASAPEPAAAHAGA